MWHTCPKRPSPLALATRGAARSPAAVAHALASIRVERRSPLAMRTSSLRSHHLVCVEDEALRLVWQRTARGAEDGVARPARRTEASTSHEKGLRVIGSINHVAHRRTLRSNGRFMGSGVVVTMLCRMRESTRASKGREQPLACRSATMSRRETGLPIALAR